MSLTHQPGGHRIRVCTVAGSWRQSWIHAGHPSGPLCRTSAGVLPCHNVLCLLLEASQA